MNLLDVLFGPQRTGGRLESRMCEPAGQIGVGALRSSQCRVVAKLEGDECSKEAPFQVRPERVGTSVNGYRSIRLSCVKSSQYFVKVYVESIEASVYVSSSVEGIVSLLLLLFFSLLLVFSPLLSPSSCPSLWRVWRRRNSRSFRGGIDSAVKTPSGNLTRKLGFFSERSRLLGEISDGSAFYLVDLLGISAVVVLCVVKGWLSGSVVYGGVGFTSGGISPFAKASYGPGFMFMPLRVRFVFLVVVLESVSAACDLELRLKCRLSQYRDIHLDIGLKILCSGFVVIASHISRGCVRWWSRQLAGGQLGWLRPLRLGKAPAMWVTPVNSPFLGYIYYGKER
ncbi:hypothetical protein YC2023_122342 [Brassica napus]